MSTAFRFTGILILTLATIAAAISAGGGKAHAAGASIDCWVPLAVECNINHPDGIANVTVAVDFGGDIGPIDVVDKDFRCQTNVVVSWDPIVPNYSIEVTPCSGFNFDSGGRGGVEPGLHGSFIILAHGDATLLPMIRPNLQYGGPDTKPRFGGPTDLVSNETMEICHRQADGTYVAMTIPIGAWAAHKAHGDGVIIGYLDDGSWLCVIIDAD